ncbi:unnamed protein product [Symbiodinium natans]|uniref:CSD domain-containing protein n=1 Tax=Symbiodinium natans TaxID=878477 RepID=A0A812UC93_9DINO|nr:unnamed protein product [Symbiodinium natans]
MFVMPWSCEGHEIFEIGTPVSFCIVQDRKTSRLRADDVAKLSASKAPAAESWRRPSEPSHPPPSQQLDEQQGHLLTDMGKFGFIQPDDGNGDVFVLPSLFPDGVLPAEGTRLAFKARYDSARQTGRPRCTEVRILQEASTRNSHSATTSSTPWRTRKWEAHESEPTAPSKREACATMWRQFCDAEGGGVYDPEEHGAPFLRQFVKRLLLPENGSHQPPSKLRRTT